MVGEILQVEPEIDDSFFADILDAINGRTAKTRIAEVCKKEETLQQKINGLIGRGVFFEIAADSFRLSGKTGATTKADIEFLTANSSAVLCHLRQMLLTRDIFNHEPLLLEDFKTEVKEREALAAADPEDISIAVHTQAVIETTRDWFADIYKEFL